NGILIDATNSNNNGLAASDNVIDSNIIAGNDNDGVLIQAHNGVAAGNRLTGNSIGANDFVSGSGFGGFAAIPNAGDGIAIDGASGNYIGPLYASTAFHNIVSANGGDGIHIIGTTVNPATANILTNNFISFDLTGP